MTCKRVSHLLFSIWPDRNSMVVWPGMVPLSCKQHPAFPLSLSLSRISSVITSLFLPLHSTSKHGFVAKISHPQHLTLFLSMHTHPQTTAGFSFTTPGTKKKQRQVRCRLGCQSCASGARWEGWGGERWSQGSCGSVQWRGKARWGGRGGLRLDARMVPAVPGPGPARWCTSGSHRVWQASRVV